VTWPVRWKWAVARLTPEQRQRVVWLCWRALARVERERAVSPEVAEAVAEMTARFPGWRRCARTDSGKAR